MRSAYVFLGDGAGLTDVGRGVEIDGTIDARALPSTGGGVGILVDEYA
jgi:hypothetical protein